MHAVGVQCIVRPEYGATNEGNMRAVMQELRLLGDVGVKYRVFRVGDGCTPTHPVIMDDGRQVG